MSTDRILNDMVRSINSTGGLASYSDLLLCFRIILGREPSLSDIEAYRDRLDQNITVSELAISFLTSYEFLRSPTASAIFKYNHEYRSNLNKYICDKTQYIVQSGPFSGMKMKAGSARGDGDISPKLLGTYEEEIHAPLLEFSHKIYEEILDVGCAEGYYTVGCALLFPGIKVTGYDIDKEALTIARELAEFNGVSEQVELEGFCDNVKLENICQGRRVLIIADCESYEKELFGNKSTAEALKYSDIVIEAHDLWDNSISPTIIKNLELTHDIISVQNGSRNPNAFDFLRPLPELERWLAVCERRAASMNWLICRAKLKR